MFCFCIFLHFILTISVSPCVADETDVDDALVHQFFTAWRYMLCIPSTYFFRHAISPKRLRWAYTLMERKIGNCLLSNGAILVTLDNPHTSIPFFIARRYAGAVYIVLWPCVRPSVRLVKGRGTARRQVATSSSMRPIATDAQQWRGLLLLRLYGNNRVASVYALPCISSFNSIVIRFQ